MSRYSIIPIYSLVYYILIFAYINIVYLIFIKPNFRNTMS